MVDDDDDDDDNSRSCHSMLFKSNKIDLTGLLKCLGC